VYGVDFTSTPSRSKPITVAECRFTGDRLLVTDLLRLSDFDRFERGLALPGPWIAGFDFPFGQPRRLLEGLGWPADWEAAVRRFSAMTRAELENLLLLYRAARPPGGKEHRRATDTAAGSLSPMKTHGVPLAKMFYEGVPRLLGSGVSILPCRPRPDERLAVEAYPGLAARQLAGRRSYKHDERRKQTGARAAARRDLVAALRSPRLAELYGFELSCGHFLTDALVRDARGDLLDAVLAAVQTAWAWSRRQEGFGIPAGADAVEGWIVDPATLGPRS
jgi:hypothetical protein